MSVADRQTSDLNSTDLVKQTVNQLLLSEEAQKVKWAQYLVSLKPKWLASPEKLTQALSRANF